MTAPARIYRGLPPPPRPPFGNPLYPKNLQVERPVDGGVDGADDEEAEEQAQGPDGAHQVPRVIGVSAGDAVPDA